MCIRIVVAVALLFQITAFGQQPPEIVAGTRDDMKGATTAFVDSTMDPALRDVIVRELGHQLPAIHIVDSELDATLVLRFSTSIPDNASADDDDARSRDVSGMQSQTNPNYAPTPRTLTAAQRTTYSPSPRIVDVPESPGTIDALAPQAPGPGLYRYATGSVLRVSGTNRYAEALTYSQGFTSSTAKAARAFVRKFAKAYREANRSAK